jgi:vacuolar-type H+-ATPase subunit H
MGRKGDLLRQLKAERVTYSFTAEQLREHDRQVIDAYKKQADQHMRKVWKEYDDRQREMEKKRDKEFSDRVNALWSEREKRFKTGYQQTDTMAMASALLTITVKVLVEDFGWVPIRNGHRTRLRRFAERVCEEITRIGTDENLDIMRYADEIDQKYGVSFMMEDDEEGESA